MSHLAPNGIKFGSLNFGSLNDKFTPMSTIPTRVDREEQISLPRPLLDDGNRVLQSIQRHEGFGALLAFSDLHVGIRRHASASDGSLIQNDLLQTERSVLDQVLQLVCARAQSITQADHVIIALAENSDLVCHASSGPFPIEPGILLGANSALLHECWKSGKAVRCDDVQADPRTQFDCSRNFGARSTVLVPLCGHSAPLGVLQAFSNAPWSFTDEHVRYLDLCAELILASLRPEDQDRRFHWLSDVAGKVLQPLTKIVEEVPEPQPASTVEVSPAHPVPPVPSVPSLPIPSATPVPAPVPVAEGDIRAIQYASIGEDATPGPSSPGEHSSPSFPSLPQLAPRAWLREFNFSSHPGLSVVLALVAVAALFSAGVWWGMKVHGGTASAPATQTPADTRTASSQPTSSSGVGQLPRNVSTVESDNLMDPAPSAPQAALSPTPDGKLAVLPKITGIRHWSSANGSTVVIDMEDQVPYEVHRLMSPERIYFDLHDTARVPELSGKTMDVGDASLTRVRVAQPVAGLTRVVLDTRGGSNFSVSMESDPYRLIVELRDIPKSLLASRAPANTPSIDKPSTSALPSARPVAPASSPLLSQSIPAKTGTFRIVLDAGHGGWDLGTVGRKGLLEKDLVLDVAQRLGRLLHEHLGAEVMFTRTGDEYLPLDQRADFANHAQADLFISVHANYSTSTTARGVETYYTNLFSAPSSKEVEKRPDGTFTPAVAVSLSSEGLHEKIEESRRLAASVQHSLYATLATKSPDIRDRGIKDAAFAVLTGTTMPAILTEISFVSSPTDERNLQSETYRQQIAEALYKGIARYQESSPRAKVAQLRPVAAQR